MFEPLGQQNEDANEDAINPSGTRGWDARRSSGKCGLLAKLACHLLAFSLVSAGHSQIVPPKSGRSRRPVPFNNIPVSWLTISTSHPVIAAVSLAVSRA